MSILGGKQLTLTERQKYIAVGVVVLCGAFLTAYFFPAALKKPASRAVSWSMEARPIYKLRYEEKLQIKVQDKPVTMETAFTAELALRPLSEDAGNIYAEALFYEPKVMLSGKEAKELSAGMELPFIVCFSRDGEMVSLSFSRECGTNEKALVASVFNAFEFSLPKEAGDKKYFTSSIGDKKSYIVEQKDGLIERREAASGDKTEALLLCELSDKFWLASADCTEENGSESTGDRLVSTLSATLRSAAFRELPLWKDTRDLEELRADFEAETDDGLPTEDVTTLPGYDGKAIDTSFYESAAQPGSAESVEASTEKLVSGGISIGKYVSLLRASPENTRRAESWYLQHYDELGESQQSMILFALQKCQTPEAEQALQDIAQSPAAETLRRLREQQRGSLPEKSKKTRENSPAEAPQSEEASSEGGTGEITELPEQKEQKEQAEPSQEKASAEAPAD